MKIKDLMIKNKHIEINIDELDFSNVGIYYLKGRNGSGKTTIIETILKENKIENLFDKLENSISYYSQKSYSYKINVDQYLDVVDSNKLNYYLDLFDISHLNGSIEKLSGGELAKLRIVRTLMKDTPILIFDEPTNNLDKKSIHVFKNILEEIRCEKTIILIFHDDRLNLEFDYIYEIRKNKIIILKQAKEKITNKYKFNKNLKINKNYFKYIFNSSFNYFLLSITIILLIFISNYNASYLQNNVQVTSEKYLNNNYMEVLNVGDQCSTYYAKDFNEEEYAYHCNEYDNLTLNDLKELSKESYIEKIYIKDELIDDFKVNKDNEKNLFSIPNIISENQNSESSLMCTNSQILKGRIPKDNKMEVALSENILVNKFNFDKDINNAIGKKLKINNKMYEIVGITKTNATCLSFNDKNQFGIITFNEANLVYFENMIKEFNKLDMDEDFSMVYVKFDEQYADKVSKKIAHLAKGHQLSSNYIFNMFEKEYYIKSLPHLIIVNVIGFSIILLLVLSLIRKTLLIINDYMNDYKNLTFEFKRINNALIKVIIINFLFALVFSLISVFLIYNLKLSLFWLMAPFYMIHLTLIIIFIKKIKLNK